MSANRGTPKFDRPSRVGLREFVRSLAKELDARPISVRSRVVCSSIWRRDHQRIRWRHDLRRWKRSRLPREIVGLTDSLKSSRVRLGTVLLDEAEIRTPH